MSLRLKKHRNTAGVDLRLFNPLVKKDSLLKRRWSNRSFILSYNNFYFHHLHHSVRPPFFIIVYKGKYIHHFHFCKPFLLNYLNILLKRIFSTIIVEIYFDLITSAESMKVLLKRTYICIKRR